MESAAIKYCSNAKSGDLDNVEKFNKECGVGKDFFKSKMLIMLSILGVHVTLEQIQDAVKALIDGKKADLDEKRYQMTGILTGMLKNQLKWANFLEVKEELDAQLLACLGPRDERDDLKNLASLLLLKLAFLTCHIDLW